ncbi:hypothetical protein [Natrinema halophilum]|uniref:hypothetical protein n=1 Tax=Natrinema halophilum TaxID=1699371 RepID=UPI001F40C519|nr:hypothetical protein [Natrinema halophilum]UHQ96134.1 hypothetical protein HYG82_22695 [Natrinema halophilum]
MIEPSSTALQWLSVGSLLMITGALIKFRGWTFLLAGYDRTSPLPDDVVADIAGNTVLRIGIAALVLGVLVAITDVPPYIPIIFQVSILFAVLRLIYRLYTYTPAEPT